MKNSSRRFFRISIFLLVIFVCVYFFLHSSFFQVDKIEVTGISMVTQPEVIELAGIKTGQNLFEINEQIVSQAVMLHPMIKQAQLIRHLPRTLEIKVTEREVWAVVPLSGEFLIVDTEGICIDKVSQFPQLDYPLITLDPMPERVNLGRAVQPEGMELIRKIWEGLSVEQRDQVSDFHYRSSGAEVVFYTKSGTEVRFGSNERIEEKLALLGQVFNLEADFAKSGKDVLEYVDLRFKGQPVVKTRS